MLQNTLTTDIPGYWNFIRSFDLIEERIFNHLKKSHTNFMKHLEIGLKLEVTLGHLSTGDIYTLGPKVKGQSWGFTSRSTARVILGQVLRIATCGTRTHRGDSL